ncbi:MAG TPA: AzlC family ABC transporter permease [Ardenticatenaceae bacterium]|jgi:4-azaleucine resistance transporter AzlC
MSTARTEFLAGVRAEIPILLAVISFGLIYGVAALSAGIPASLAQAMSFIVFAGSAQFVMVQLVDAGAPGLVIVGTLFVVNLRHLLYSASIAPYLQHLRGSWKALLAYLLTDEAYVVAIVRYQQKGEAGNRHWYFLGCGVALWTTWQASTAAGILLGAQIPPGLPLDFAIPLTFIALAVPIIKDRASVAAAITAGVVVLLTMDLPFRLGLIVAALAGMVVGVLVEGRKK